MASAVQHTRRYPGLKPFDRAQSALFRGRSEDVQRLSNLIVRERLVVLFAKSGIGKTSILQAGVAPQLEGKGFLPIFLRADKINSPLSISIGEALQNHPNVGSTNHTGLMIGEYQTLWERMKRLEFDLDGFPATPVLVLDQFEETFTLSHTESSRSQFLHELADLVNLQLPETVRQYLMASAAESGKLAPELMQWWEQHPDLRIVISIRSDFLHLLDEISPLIPGILLNRFQLQALNRRQAQEAVEAPANAAGNYASPRFQYAPEAVKVILDYLAGRETSAEIATSDAATLLKKQDEIESFNLQILCRHIEELIIEQKQPEGFVVTPNFFGGKDGLEREIRDFYNNQLRALPQSHTRRTGESIADPEAFISTAQRLIEESLVTAAGRRCSMVDDFLTQEWNVDTEFLNTLVESRLLRKELRLDDFYYEISHDTLLPTIVESRDTRRAREKADAEKQRLTEELRVEALKTRQMEEEIAQMKKQRRLARMVTWLALGMLALSLLFGAWFTYEWAQSVQEELLAAEENCRNEQFDAAVASFDAIGHNYYKKTFLGRAVGLKRAETLEFKQYFDAIQREMTAGDALFFNEENEDLRGALDHYRNALDSLKTYDTINYAWRDRKNIEYWRVNPNKIEERRQAVIQRINSTRRILISQFEARQREAEAFKEAGLWGQQMRNITAMERLLPHHQEDIWALLNQLQLRNQTPAEYVAAEKKQCQRELNSLK